VQNTLTVLSTLLDGLPGLSPVALPPKCIEDPRRKKHIGALGKAIEAVLGQERGKRVCAGEVPILREFEGGEAKRWGLEMGALKELMKQKTAVSFAHILLSHDLKISVRIPATAHRYL